MDAEVKHLLRQITHLSDDTKLKEIISKLNELKRSFNDSQDDLIKAAIIEFFTSTNPLLPIWKENDIPEITNNFIKSYDESVKNKLTEEAIKNIKNPLLKFLISIDEFFPAEKNVLKLCFKIILLTQNKETLINYLRKFFSTNIKDLENEILKLNFNNPFSIMFIHEALKSIFIEKNGEEKIVDIINKKIKNIQIFRCGKCFDLLYVTHSTNGTSLICNDSSHNILESTELRTLHIFDLVCCECNNLIKIYLDNYKCIKCKKFICNNCFKAHENNCLSSEMIYLYNVGYTCETHNKKYIDSCELCNKNLCEECKLYHFHIIKDNCHIKLNEGELHKSMNSKKLDKTKKYIKYYLIKRYFYMKEFGLINVKVIKPIHFFVEKTQIACNPKLFFSSAFFNEEFKEYYKYIIEKAKNGSEKEFDNLVLLEKEYKLVKLFSENAEYNKFIYLCILNQRERNEILNNIYSGISNGLLSIQAMFNNSRVFGVKRLYDETNTNLILLKNQIIKVNKSNEMGQLFNKKLLTRYFADYIIKMLIKKYHMKFKQIELSLINIYEIVKTYGFDFISDNHVELINSLINVFLSEKDKKDKEKNFLEYINKIKEGNKVIFDESIEINGKIIKKEELNFVLGTLLYSKLLGTNVAHPNIISEIETIINEINTNVKTLNSFIEKSTKSNNSDNSNSLVDLELINDTKKILKELVVELLKGFEDISFDKKAELEYILDYMFKNKSENIIKKDSAFLRVIKSKIEEIVNDANDFDELNIINDIKNDEDDDDIINPKEILKNIENYENIIKDKINKFGNYNLKTDKILENKMKSEVKNIESLDLTTFPMLLDKYEEIMQKIKNLSYPEKKSYLASLFAREYLGSDTYINKKKKLIMKIKKFIKFRIIRTKMKKISKCIKSLLDKSIKDIDENKFIKEVKEFIKEQKLIVPEILSILSLDISEIIKIIQLLLDEKTINWLILSPEESASISSYLFFMQNKKK